MIGLTAPFGLLVLLVVAAVAALLILSGVIAHSAVHPPRHTPGWAVAHGLPADPGDRGLEFESWTLDLPREVRLPVWEITARGDGPTAVFVHDWGESRIDLLARIDPWLDQVERIVLSDRRGHGDATGSNARLGAGEHEDVHALLDRLGDGPFILAGHGTGAPVAIAAAATATGRNISMVSTHAMASDPHAVVRDRLRSRGLPARPLTDLAMLWLALTGIRRRDVKADEASLRCPLAASTHFRPSASSSGSRCGSNPLERPIEER